MSYPPSLETITPEASELPAASESPAPKRVARPTRAGRRAATPWEDEAALVREILAGSRPHFDMLYEAYFPRVYRFALKRLRDTGEAEDVTQEVFITVFRALRTFQGDSSLLVWIFGITRNKVNRRFRRPRPRLESIDNDALEIANEESATDQTVDARRVLDRCQHAIEHQLTPLQRRIFHLKHLRRQSIRSATNSAPLPCGTTSKAPLPKPAILYSIRLPGSIAVRRNRITWSFPCRNSRHSISDPGWCMEPLSIRQATWSGCQETYY